MGEFVECVQGIGEACEYLKFPVVSVMYLFIIKQKMLELNQLLYWWSWFNKRL